VARGQGAAGRRGAAPPLSDVAVAVCDLAGARCALEAAAELGLRLRLVSDADVAAIAGPAFIHALSELVGEEIIVDCGTDAGLALGALRIGCRHLLFAGNRTALRRLGDIARQLDGEVMAEIGAPVVVATPLRTLPRRLAAMVQRPPPAISPGGARVEEGSAGRRGRAIGDDRAMQVTARIKEILSWYEGENPGVKTNLVRLLMNGRLAGTGKLVILPVDQGYEHGPARSFAPNPPAYDPHYLYELALEAGLSGYAAPLGLLEQGADTFAGQVPLILKLNSANSLAAGQPDQAVTASVSDALRLGCVGVGYTIYPGADSCYDQMEKLREIIREAKSKGLLAVVWSYPRGGKVSKEGETALDIVAYAAHMAALMGATIIKVKPPSDRIDLDAAKATYEKATVQSHPLEERIAHIMQCTFNGKRLVVFSGGEAKSTEGILKEIRQIRDGGASGSIIGRNSFQRTKSDALGRLDEVIKIYLDKA
jgi:class I fructose-bisphosphate aldolase